MASATASAVSCLAQFKPGSAMLGFRIIPSSITLCTVKLVEDASQDVLGDLPAALQSMVALHEHFRLDDGDQPASWHKAA